MTAELTWAEVAALELDDTPTETLAQRVLAEDVYETRVDHEFVVRDAIARIHVLNARIERTKKLKAQIVKRYDASIESDTADIERLRDSVQTFIERMNDGKAISFPDVGSAHLRTVNKGGKAKVADVAAFEAYVRAELEKLVPAVVETVEEFDAKKALDLVIDELGLKVTPAGSLVDATTGEDVTEKMQAAGLDVDAEEKGLTVKGAA